MSNQSKFVPPELLPHVLAQLSLIEQFELRYVNKEFKHVIENVIWPTCKRIEFCRYEDITLSDFEQIVSHMPHLRVLKLEICREQETEYATMLAKYCHKIKKFGKGSQPSFARKYQEQLLKCGHNVEYIDLTDISEGQYLNMFLDNIPKDGSILIKSCLRLDGIPDKYRHMIVEGLYCENMPYFKNLRKIIKPSINFDFIQLYKDQLKKIIWYCLEQSDKLHYFVNLQSLHIRYEDKPTLNDESENLQSLEHFLESDNSRHLQKLHVLLFYTQNLERLINTLCTLNRPRKWKELQLSDDHLSISFKNRKLVAQLSNIADDSDLNWISEILKIVRTAEKIKFEVNDSEPTISNAQFVVLKKWIESYASKHRNMQIKLTLYVNVEIWENFEDVVCSYSDNNWTIFYNRNLLSDKLELIR